MGVEGSGILMSFDKNLFILLLVLLQYLQHPH